MSHPLKHQKENEETDQIKEHELTKNANSRAIKETRKYSTPLLTDTYKTK